MPEFQHRTELPVSAETAFAWHARPGAFQRLAAPWQQVEVLEQRDGIQDGGLIVFRLKQGPIWLRWVARHRGFEQGRRFIDVQEEGPFRSWKHTHTFQPDGDNRCVLLDHISYELPFGGGLLAGSIRADMEKLFRFRATRLQHDLGRHATNPTPLRIAVTGASGLVGSALVPFLTTGGHQVHRLVRREAKAGEISWDPAAGTIDAAALEGLDAVIHLAGENLAGQSWTPAFKQKILDSRIQGTGLMARTLAGLSRPPQVFISASAVGIYGDRQDPVDETSTAGEGFLPQVCQAWEQATDPAAQAGIRLVTLRTGVVLSTQSGALAKMLPAYRAGVGGVIGSGRQGMSWVALDDLLGAIHQSLTDTALHGPINAVAPQPVSNREFVKTLGKVLRRPTFAPLPAAAVRAMFGEMGEATILEGAFVRPARLQAAGFHFQFPALEGLLRHELGQ